MNWTPLAVPKEMKANQHPIHVDRVVDGDTFIASVVLGYGVTLTDQRVRIEGLDAWEMGDEKGPGAKAELERIVSAAKVLVLVSATSYRDRYGRLLGRVLADGVDVGVMMTEAGYAEL